MLTRTVLLLALAAVSAGAQRTQDIPQRVEEPNRQQESIEQSRRASEQGRKEREAAGEDITYEQVLSDPDNIELNYQFARSQVRKGNMRSAAATLERVLMVNPDLPKIRLFYAVVLFRLDNLDDAQRELDTLKAQKMPESLRSELNSYLAQIRSRRMRTRYNVLLGLGVDYDTNKNAAPLHDLRLFFGAPVRLDKKSVAQADETETYLGSLGFTHDLGYQAGHNIYGSYNYYRAEAEHQKILNLQSHSVELGFVYKTPKVDYTVDFEGSHVLLAQTSFLRQRGGRLHMDFKASPRLVPFLEAAHTYQRYNKTAVVPAADDRNGDKIEGTGGLRYVLTPTMSVLGSYSRVQQGAVNNVFALARDSFNLSHTWLLGKGTFLLTTGNVSLDRYVRPDRVVSVVPRVDNTYRARTTYGFPLDAIFRSKIVEDFVMTWSYEYYHASSTLLNYTYDDNKASMLLTYKWEH